jgi:hypothetical protein
LQPVLLLLLPLTRPPLLLLLLLLTQPLLPPLLLLWPLAQTQPQSQAGQGWCVTLVLCQLPLSLL